MRHNLASQALIELEIRRIMRRHRVDRDEAVRIYWRQFTC
jgi:hypothetical protein